MARQQLGKALSGGVIALCVVLLLTPITYGQMRGVRQKFTVSGSVGLSGVTIQGLPGAPVTDENGVYTAEVVYGTKLTIRPVKRGYTFEPSQITYEKVTEHKTDGNFTAQLVTFKISGSVGKSGVFMQGLPDNVMSDASGQYSAEVSYGFTGTVVPTLEGYRFDPPSVTYDQVTKPQVQNYKPEEVTFTISGTVGAAGVEMKGFPEKVVSDKENRYTAQVPYNWEGTVTPVKEGHQFTPEQITYPPVTMSLTDELYIAHVDMYKISGSTNLANVMLKGLPGDPLSDTEGYYEIEVPHGWEGKVTPFRAGWEFQPPSMTYTPVTSVRENQNYNASEVQLTISGRAVAGAVMRGLPGNPTADASGFYKAQVSYGWVGDITPVKDGYEFDPPSYAITSLTKDETNRNFRAKPITYTISGNVGFKGVRLMGLPGSPISDADGNYSAPVKHKFSGTVRPVLSGYQFDPPTREYVDLTSSLPSENYRCSVIQHELSGRIVAESGSAEGILIRADNGGGSIMTDASGNYTLLVDHGWQGTITPVKEGYTFTPPSRQYGQIFQPRSNIAFYGKVKMLTITDSIIFEDGPEPEPIEDVLITAQPDEGGTIKPVTTGADGKYRIQVPYGWSGELIPTKEGFNFYPPSTEYLIPVTSDIDKTSPKPAETATTTPPVDTSTTVPPADTTTTPPPADTTTTPPADTTTTPPADTATTPPTDTTSLPPDLEAKRQELMRQLAEIDAQGTGSETQPVEDKPDTIATLPPIDEKPVVTPPTPPALGPTRTTTLSLLDVLEWMEKKTGVKIEPDVTVKGDPVAVGFDLNSVNPETLSQALQNLLEDTDYMFRRQDDGYLVFRPISNEFLQDDLRDALQNIGYAAGMAIIPDANVGGLTSVSINNQPLDTALEILLAGTAFTVKKTPDYYLVADRSVNSDAFWDTSETRHIKLSYTTPASVATHLSSAFKEYVNANTDPNSRVISVTAPPVIVDRIVDDIKSFDVRPEHVILEARVVAMERNDLINLGVEWGWPNLEVGAFDSSLTGDSIWAAALGYSADAAFTDSLLLALNLLEQNEQADVIAKPVVTAQDGKMSDIAVMDEEYYILTPQTASGYYTMSEMVTITSGTKLAITPYIGDNNDITLEIATEVSESIPAGPSTDLPIVTRRTSRNVTTVKDGGTVALAGLSRTHSKLIEKSVPGFSSLPFVGNLFKNKERDEMTQEVAIFVTASLVRELPDRLSSRARVEEPRPAPVRSAPELSDNDFRNQLMDKMASGRQ